MAQLARLVRLSGLVRQHRIGAAGAARARADALRDDLAATVLVAPPAGADPALAAQHARWAEARRRRLAQELIRAEIDAASKAAAARRAVGVDGVIARIADRLAEEHRRKTRRG